MDIVIEKGRPKNMDGRELKEIKSYDFLDSLGIDYLRADHEATNTMETCKIVDDALGISIRKNLFLCNRQKTRYYILLMTGEKTFKTSEVSSQIGSSRLSFASPEDMEKYLNITPGSVSILGLMNDTENEVSLLIDEDVLKYEYFGCHPCKNTSTLKFKTSDLLKKVLPALKHSYVTVKL